MDSEKIFFLSGVSLAVAVGLYVLWGPSTTKKKKKSGIIGLVNLGHTCFLNTLLQALASCPTFISWLSWHANREDKSKDGYHPGDRTFSSLAAAIYKVILVLNGSEINEQLNDGSPYAPYCVLDALGKRGWAISPGEQDAHELFHALLSTMGEEIEGNDVPMHGGDRNNRSKNGLCLDSHKPSLTDALFPLGSNAGLEYLADVGTLYTNSQRNELDEPTLNNHMFEDNQMQEVAVVSKDQTSINPNQKSSVNELILEKELTDSLNVENEGSVVKIVLSESSKVQDNASVENLVVSEDGDGDKFSDLLGKPLDSLSVYASSYPGSPNPSRSPVSVQSPTHSASPSGSPKKKIYQHSRRAYSSLAINWRQRVLRYSDDRYMSQQLECGTWDATGGLVSSLSGSPFRGLLTSQLKCMSCGFKSAVRYDKFDSLSLSLPSRGNVVDMSNLLGSANTRKGVTLEYLLHRFVSREIVEGVACDGCTLKRKQENGAALTLDNKNSSPVKSTFLKWLNFGRLPKCLCFHIQRTTWFDNGQTSKRHDFVAFPEYLCMEMYTYLQASMRESRVLSLKSLKEESSIGNRLSKSQQSLEIEKIKPKIPLSPPETKEKSSVKVDMGAPSTSEGKLWHRPSIHRRNTFRLTAVVVHLGDSNSGHFVTYRRGPPHPASIKERQQKALGTSFKRNGELSFHSSRNPLSTDDSRWYYTSDTEVVECSLSKVLESVAYMLFYEKVLPSHG